MSRVPLGMLLGLVIGALDVGLMLPLSFPDKRAALLGAFCARFALGFFAATGRKRRRELQTLNRCGCER